MAQKYYLGFDLSTQALKVFVADKSLNLQCEVCVKYEEDLPHYGLADIFQKSGNSVACPVAMWIEALDLAMEKLSQLVDLNLVVGIGGCAQQHGTVYTAQGFLAALQTADVSLPLHTQLQDYFTLPLSPIWMDSSTEEYCERLEEKIGSEELCNRTGSRAHARFSVHHIHRMVNESPELYESTERILLVSNFLGTLLTGKYMAIDFSDGSGMNLLDVFQKEWIKDISGFYNGVDISDKLGAPEPTLQEADEVAATISDYLVTRYGFNKECKVFRCTGDNPATLVGMSCRDQDLILSLGTSDVLIGVSGHVTPSPDIHVFCNPLNSNSHMFIICYKNGSLVREELKDKYCEGEWERYNQMLSTQDNPPLVGNYLPLPASTLVGNYLPLPETCPAGLVGAFCSTDPERLLLSHPPETIVRTVTEGQFLSKRHDISAAGFKPTSNTRLIVVGGGSVNNTLLNLISNVFGVDVYRASSANAAARGAALLAFAGVNGVRRMEELRTEYELVSKTNPELYHTYCGMRENYVDLQKEYLYSSLHKE